MLKNVYEGLDARPIVYLSKEYFCEMYPTCVSSKLCEFILFCLTAFYFFLFATDLIFPPFQQFKFSHFFPTLRGLLQISVNFMLDF